MGARPGSLDLKIKAAGQEHDMDVTIETPEAPLPVDRAHVVSIVIKSFKGRRDVEVHLFRTQWEEQELGQIDWDSVLASGSADTDPPAIDRTRRFLMEAFTPGERDLLVAYLSERYSDRVERISSTPLSFPLPAGILPLDEAPLGQDVGLIRFEAVPNYTLPFAVHGLFDLSRHKPMVEMAENA
jgi:hypothetical protein